VIKHHGTISAEHGIGVAKTAWLKRARTTGDYAAMQAVKHALDPHQLLNPGVIFPACAGGQL
jgi:FAD/FMN-containing dehydrogenase